MRISDWSSDVCSSDLLLFELLLDREDRLARREAGAVADAEDMGVDREGLRPEGRVHHDIRRLAPDAGQFDARVTLGGDLSAMIADQIGSASCRESVGQSVQTAVVAGSLRKKKIIK